MAMLGTKPLASLSSGLLARKGQAKPAMRPQGFGGFASTHAAAMEDLGWNDMGGTEPAPPAPAPTPTLVSPLPVPADPVPVPPVVSLRESLAAKVEAEAHRDVEADVQTATPSPTPTPEPRPVSLATAQRIGRDSAKQTKNGKAAFTLRLDAERHLKLRLASALSGRSAQIMVTEAVDAMLREMTEVDALVAQLPEPKRRR